MKAKTNQPEKLKTQRGRVEQLVRHPEFGYYYFPVNKTELEEFYRERYHQENNLFEVWAQTFEESRWWLDLHVTLAALLFKKYFPQARTLLDIGCGVGNHLVLFRDKGYEVQGIDFSVQGCRIAQSRGLNVIQGNVLDHIAGIGKKDIVHAHGVMEHYCDPLLFLDEIKKLLVRNKSLLLISVPNDFNPLQRQAMERCGHEAYFLSYPDHINYFDFESLTRVLKAKKFKIHELYSDFPMELFLLFGQDYTKDPKVGKACHQQRLCFERAFVGQEEKLLKIYRGFAGQNIGRFAHALVSL